MEQICTLFCSITEFNVISSSIMKNVTTFQELSRMPENTQG